MENTGNHGEGDADGYRRRDIDGGLGLDDTYDICLSYLEFYDLEHSDDSLFCFDWTKSNS